MLGHKNVSTTQKYLGVNYKNLRDAVENMAFGRKITEVEKITLKSATTEQLINELQKRGYKIQTIPHRQKYNAL